MTSSKSTKRALIFSALAILMCVAMLIGTTFAWFTDTASTGVNKIVAGNLDIEVKYTLDGEEWKDLAGAADLYPKTAGESAARCRELHCPQPSFSARAE